MDLLSPAAAGPATLPDVVETLAVDTLRASGAWAAVHESPSPFSADYLLQINIRRFEADYTGGGSKPEGARDAGLHARRAARPRAGHQLRC